jgi:hypothetical protein
MLQNKLWRFTGRRRRNQRCQSVESSRNVMAHGDAREGKWRGNWRMEWVAILFTLGRNTVYPALLPLMRTPRLPVVDWTDAPRRFKWTLSVSPKDEIWFLRVCHHISTGLYRQHCAFRQAACLPPGQRGSFLCAQRHSKFVEMKLTPECPDSCLSPHILTSQNAFVFQILFPRLIFAFAHIVSLWSWQPCGVPVINITSFRS